MNQAYVALGGNLGSPAATIEKALEQISALERVLNFRKSRLYETDPISSIPQNAYINAVCTFETEMTPEELLTKLQQIEKALGKKPKAKDAPRPIDLDLLFLGSETRNTADLQLPHPEWRNRLFVLRPLLDLTDEIIYLETINIRKLVESFKPTGKVRVLNA